jgi:hypothetical protein
VEEKGEHDQATESLARTLSNINEIFEFWRVRMGHTRARLDQKRRSKIRQRLCDGYKLQDIIDAIEGCALSTFHMGQNDRSTVYNDIELICRDAKHVDQFIKIWETEKAKRARRAAEERARKEESDRIERERQARRARAEGGDNIRPIWGRTKIA